MAQFDELKQKAQKAAEAIADKSFELYKMAEEKAKVLARTAKLTAEIAVEKGNVRKLYREIGKLYYDLNKSSPDPAFAQACEEVTAALERIEAKQREIDELNNAFDLGGAGGSPDAAEDAEIEIVVEGDDVQETKAEDEDDEPPEDQI